MTDSDNNADNGMTPDGFEAFDYSTEQRALLVTLGLHTGEGAIPNPGLLRTMLDGMTRAEQQAQRDHELDTAEGSIHVEGTSAFCDSFLSRLRGQRIQRVERVEREPLSIPGIGSVDDVLQGIVGVVSEAEGIEFRKVNDGIILIGSKPEHAMIVLVAPVSSLGIEPGVTIDGLLALLNPPPVVAPTKRGRANKGNRTPEQIVKDAARMKKYRDAKKAKAEAAAAAAEDAGTTTDATEADAPAADAAPKKRKGTKATPPATVEDDAAAESLGAGIVAQEAGF